MIPAAITQDLRAGNTLEDTLIKHGTNLKELFHQNSKLSKNHFDDWSYIQPTKSNTFRVAKVIKGHRIEFGTYKSHEDALLIRNELIKCGWDKNKLPEILEKNNIFRNSYGGARR